MTEYNLTHDMSVVNTHGNDCFHLRGGPGKKCLMWSCFTPKPFIPVSDGRGGWELPRGVEL